MDITQSDLCNTGSITEAKKICDIAQAHDVGVQIHVCDGPIAMAVALQAETAVPNFITHEKHNANLLEIFKESEKHCHAPVNGFYEVLKLPGIGQGMNEQAMATMRKVVAE